MFTGIVQETGTVDRIVRSGSRLRLRIRSSFKEGEIRTGDSVNVNGACLTVETGTPPLFEVHVSRETMMRTTLSGLREGEKVNLELAMRAGDRFGGHMVQGHVDGTGKVVRISRSGEDTVLRVSHPDHLGEFVVEKGSVSMNGVSLTVSAQRKSWFEVTLIPHTLKNTNLSSLKVGYRVNIETDILGKYMKKFLEKKSR